MNDAYSNMIKPIPLKHLKNRLERAENKSEFIKEELYILYRFLNDWQMFLSQRQEIKHPHARIYKVFKNLTEHTDTVDSEIKQAQEHINVLKEKINYLESINNFV